MPELRSYSDFSDDGSTRPEALVSRAMISNVQTSCSLDKNSVTVDLKTTFSGTLGPQGRWAAGDKPFFSYPFFVAVAAAGGKILTKEIYAASITYPPGRNSHSYNENMRFILPMETRDQGRNQKILLGFIFPIYNFFAIGVLLLFFFIMQCIEKFFKFLDHFFKLKKNFE